MKHLILPDINNKKACRQYMRARIKFHKKRIRKDKFRKFKTKIINKFKYYYIVYIKP